MKTLRFTTLCLFTAALLTGCDKDKETVTPQTPRPDLLVGKDWKLTARTVTPGIRLADGRVVTDIYAEMPSYDRDDLLHFEKPDVYTYDEGPTKQDAGMPQNYRGTWSLGNNDQTLTTTAATLGTSSYDVEELTASTMRLHGVKTENGVRYTYTLTFAKQ